MKTGYKVVDIMTTKPVVVEPEISVKNCAILMKNNNVGSVLVLDGKNVLGILTEKDIIIKITAEGKDASKSLVKEIMTVKEEMTTIEPGEDIYEALIVMNENTVRRLPVMEGNALRGIITMKDILKIEPDLFDILVDKIDLKEEARKFSAVDGYDVTQDEDEP